MPNHTQNGGSLLNGDRLVPRPVQFENVSDHTATTSDLVDLGQVWTAIRGRWGFIVVSALTVGCLVLLYTLVSGMRFRATAQLYLGDVARKASVVQEPPGGFDFSGGSQEKVASEIEIIRSRSLVRRTALETGLNVSITAPGVRDLTYWQWRKSGRDANLIDGALDFVRATDTTLAANILEPRRYGVKFLDASAYELSSRSVSLGQGKLGQPHNAPGLSLTLVQGSKGEPKAGSQYEIVVKPLDVVVDDALRALRVAAPKESAGGESVDVVTLEFSGSSPRLATNFLLKLMSVYLNERQAWKTEDAQAAEAFVSGQLLSVRGSLDQLQNKLAEYRSSNGVVVLDNQAKAMIEQIGKYEEQRATARLQVAALADMSRALKAPNPATGAFLVGEANDTVLETLSKSLSQAREKLTDLETRFQDAAPEVREQRARVAAQLDSVRSYVSSRQQRAQGNLGTVNAIIGQFENKLKTVPGAEVGLAQLTRESEVYGKTYSFLLERQQQAGIVKASNLSKNRILDAPEIPLREDSPNLILRVASILVGLILAAGFVAVRAVFGGKLQSVGDVHRSLGSVPIFASIPRHKRNRKGAVVDLVAQYPNSRFAEAFRMVRVKVYVWEAQTFGNVIVVTSPNVADGKTTCVESLASVLCADGKTVLVVDADLRRSTKGNADSDTDEPGLREVLSGECDWRHAVRQVPQSFAVRYRMSSGGVGTPELLNSENMLRFLIDVRGVFDYILIDGPSFPQASEVLGLARMADITLSVLRLRYTSKKLTSEHMAQVSGFAQRHAVIINDADIAFGLRGRDARAAVSERQAVTRVSSDGTRNIAALAHVGPPSRSFVVTSSRTGKDARYKGLPPSQGANERT